MVGGDEDVFKKAEPVIDCYSRKVKLIGEIRKWSIN
jgi:3-hydroxyisobutyrate dehydrogenase-like beta-hydroxyacid dehydrogenase